MNLNARMAFVGIAVVLVALVVGVPVLGAVFAQGGPFGQLVGVTDGTCEYIPSGTFSSAIAVPTAAADQTFVLDRRVTVSDGTALRTALRNKAGTPVAIGGLTVGGEAANKVRIIESGGRDYVVAAGKGTGAITGSIGTACSSAAADILPTQIATPPATNGATSVALTNDSQLSNNRYAGILSAMILLIPLAVVVFFAMRFVQARMER